MNLGSTTTTIYVSQLDVALPALMCEFMVWFCLRGRGLSYISPTFANFTPAPSELTQRAVYGLPTSPAESTARLPLLGYYHRSCAVVRWWADDVDP